MTEGYVFLECCSDALLSVLGSGPLDASCHLAFIAGLAGRTHFDGGVFKRSCCNSHLVPTLQLMHKYMIYIST